MHSISNSEFFLPRRVSSKVKQVRTGVIGCGGIAERAHIPNLLAEPQVRLEALADINESKLRLIQQNFNFPADKSFTDYARVLDLQDVDAVIVATPADTHGEIVLKALEAGKHVFVEKPLSTTVAEAETIARIAKQTNLKVMVGYQHRFVASHKIAKRYLRTGKIGVPFFGEVHSESLIVKPEEGILLDYGVHLIDLLCWYLNDSKVEEVAAFSYSDKEGAKEKHAIIIMRFGNGVLGRIGVFYMEGYLMSRLRGPHTFMPRGALEEKLPLTDAAYREEMHDFIQSILRDRKPSVDAEQGLMVQKVLDAVQQSIA